MYSVTQRIEQVTQPFGGYIKPRLLECHQYKDRKRPHLITSKYKAIAGMAVDYLTRFQMGTPKEEAFRVSLLGAKIVFEEDKAHDLVDGIKGLDKRSIINACRLTGYDIAYRASAEKFIPVDHIQPSDDVIHSIKIFVQRTCTFLESSGPIIMSGATFPGGYTGVVTSGDCDYVTADTLWDLKVSYDKPSSAHTLQLLMYYILGLHSEHSEFQYLRRLGIYNPALNCAYTIPLTRIPDAVYQSVSRDVLGYQTPDDPSQWRLAFGTDPAVFDKAFKYYYSDHFHDSGFRPDNFPDGIHDISIEDYWSYWKTIRNGVQNRPKFTYTQSIKFLKRNGFVMFLSISHSGKHFVLYGGNRRKLEHPITYYYEHLGEYGQAVLCRFSKYWDALYSISKVVQAIPADPEIVRKTTYAAYVQQMKSYRLEALNFDSWCRTHKEELHLTGRVHGCIVDLDFSNHIYLNPYDGAVAPYFALSTQDKFVYMNVASLLSEQRPEMLPGYLEQISSQPTALIASGSAEQHAMVSFTDTHILPQNIPVTDTSMYELSNKLVELQMVYDHRFIGVWYDHFLSEHSLGSGAPALMSGSESSVPTSTR